MSLLKTFVSAIKGKFALNEYLKKDEMIIILDTDNPVIISCFLKNIDNLLYKNNKSKAVVFYTDRIDVTVYEADSEKCLFKLVNFSKLKHMEDYVSTNKDWAGNLIGIARSNIRIISEYDYTGYPFQNLLKSENCNVEELVKGRLLLL